MEKSEKEAHDFMSVDSFSQLPFIRPPPPAREKPVRLFGIEFPGQKVDDDDDNISGEPDSSEANVREGAKDSEDSGRRFECHYCCRNFPTSQALGGHQNAHKRERQLAKRAHLQSALAHASIYDSSHVYGLLNYRLGSAPPGPALLHSALPSSRTFEHEPIYGRLYGRHVAASQPIDGNPLPGLWRIPVVPGNGLLNQDRSLPLPLPLPRFSARDDGSPRTHHVYESTASSVRDHMDVAKHDTRIN